MTNRMDKYKDTDNIPKRSEKNQELYKQIYNAYDEFENLIVPSNTREINPSDLKKEITSRDEYRKVKEYGNITNNKVIRKEIVREVQKKENEIYDINQLLDKAVSTTKSEDVLEPKLSSGDYLKKLNINNHKTNLEQVKEMYSDMENDFPQDNEDSLIHTASLSLEILSDLKGDNDNTMVDGQVIDDDSDFYSNNYKFSKRDFEDRKESNLVIKEKKNKKEEKKEEKDTSAEENDDDEDDDFYDDEDNNHTFLKTFFLIFGILLVAGVIVYLFYYFGKI